MMTPHFKPVTVVLGFKSQGEFSDEKAAFLKDEFLLPSVILENAQITKTVVAAQ